MLKIETKLDEGGKITIPDEYRRAIGLETGDTVILVLEKGELRVIPSSEAIKHAQALVRRYIPKERVLSEELIRERRTEAANE
jgi:AbrB family looped-hinge helix DNA binding protein